RQFRDSNRKGARRARDRYGFDAQSGFTQATRRRCCDRYTKQKFEDVAHDVDLVLDPVGRDTLARSYGVVKKGGIVVTIVSRCDPAELEKHGIRGASLSSHPDAKELGEITKLIDGGKIKPIVTEVLPLTDA